MTATWTSPESAIPPRLSSNVALVFVNAFLATLAGLALRLLFVLRFPALAGDSAIYLQLARNWADHHTYGLWINGNLAPTDLRLPGYPAFLAGVASLFRRFTSSILLSQAGIDLCTCFLTVALAVALVPKASRRRVAIASLWLAATCPFLANYSAVVLTEVLCAFFATGALVCFALSLGGEVIEYSWHGHRRQVTTVALAAAGAFLTGVASLVRPEMPLLLMAMAAVVALRWWHPGWRKLTRIGATMAVAFLLPLAPWAARNFVTLREFQISAPRYTTVAGEYATVGFFAWTKTWLVRYRDVYLTVWKFGEQPINIEDVPESAFENAKEKAQIANLLQRYNKIPDFDVSPELDHEFAEIARERTARNPLRTFVWVPFQRALTIWFTPRTELIPSNATIWPISEHWGENPLDVLVAIFFACLNYVYVGLALGGIWVVWRARRATGSGEPVPEAANLWGIALLVAYLAARTAFLTTVEAPEPRYVVPCFPTVLALAALLWSRELRWHRNCKTAE